MGKRYLIDTNVVTKYLTEELSENGLDLIDSIIDAGDAQISVISRIELLGFAPKSDHLAQFIKQFLQIFNEFGIAEDIVQKTIKIRKAYRIKIPDAIIAATALTSDLILLSDNDSDFGKVSGLKYINPRKYTL
ncbi:type II toxin-antitoxin system VapC family toxin [Dyadobacter alkalitolerans]|uniref:type II toxin-antitoxin system VapC family toxin n=1 Tax=Dyadobacter alkalitolerans TaxID=492736 RepID=UPI000423C82C|nr:type II toxin-antitoxin system VapC family toxin [Dyadobacter alkalitolerans]